MANRKRRNLSANRGGDTRENYGRSAGAGDMENVSKDQPQQRDTRGITGSGKRRDPAQAHDLGGEAQNVNDDTGRPMDEEETKRARNKAMEGNRQDRDDSDSGNNSKVYR